ncbi:hypothetical protein BpHYR1_035549 [Brachionus plicatilis]|uniref:Uncharacterized protein n=1 Tax=Brachionus plicatilis TaxID=10195 RepID=A0A3M7PFZ5_BRAPC|nr:hypothetical protein BpHYR1_035549 [Brachionus plicatilis]
MYKYWNILIKLIIQIAVSVLKGVFEGQKWPKVALLREKDRNTQRTNVQINIVHVEVESESKVLNLTVVENRPAKRSRGRPRKNPVNG